MNARRMKLTARIAMQTAAIAPGEHAIAELRTYPVREPVSGRVYTIVRIQTRSGSTGWGECSFISAADTEKARTALIGKPATSWAVLKTNTPLDGAIDMALLDISARICNAPVFRLLGGPTRFKVRALAPLHGDTEAELSQSMSVAFKAGFRAFRVPLPPTGFRNQGQAFDKSIRARMEGLRSAAQGPADFVLDGAGLLTPGDAASVAASLERFHLLWFDEPCPISNLRTIDKITAETVTPLGFGRGLGDLSIFQDLMRDGLIDILRPDLHQYGISRIRQVAALAETYYTAVAPNHEGGPVATAAALHLAAALPNFFIQNIPWPAAAQDRTMRTTLISPAVETVRDGFIPLPSGPGLGIQVNEAALERYKA